MFKPMITLLAVALLAGCGVSPAAPTQGSFARAMGASAKSAPIQIARLSLEIEEHDDPWRRYGMSMDFGGAVEMSKDGVKQQLTVHGYRMEGRSPWTGRPDSLHVSASRNGKWMDEAAKKAWLAELKRAKLAAGVSRQSFLRLVSFVERDVEEHEAYKKQKGDR